ncbi:MAG: oxidoreductase [Lentisphaerae bacterium RIFOXYA12_FULL_48_11]|nr:MAG: oxidoreductase [Lentisphaerae bacterium RIFOXYA12_FULL_48_11]
MMNYSMNRREFLAMSAAVGALGVFSGCATTAPRKISPNSKLNHACIGVGGMMGGGDLGNFLSHPRTQVVAICDVDSNHLDKAAAKVPGARKYTDWREMLAKEGDKIDSINATVPDHMHALIAMSAIRKGKHVYCQKPLCHDVAECRALALAAKKAGVVTQLGTQYASGIGDRTAVQFLREGAIGKIKRVILCSNRPGAIDAYRLVGPRPAVGEQAPASLSWDLWLGTAPERSFASGIYHPVKWRAWQDFGTGWSGDIGCHVFDAVWKGLGLTAPVSVVAEVQESWKNSRERRGDTWPQSDHITWMFPGSDKTEGRELPVEWFDGLMYPPDDVQAIAKDAGFKEYPPESAMVIGTDGALLVPHTSGAILLPKDKFKDYRKPDLKGRNHYHHFIDACLGGEMAESHFVQTGPMAEAIILGTVAIRVPGTVLKWDAARMKVTNSPEAQKLIKRSYRKGWEVKGV